MFVCLFVYLFFIYFCCFRCGVILDVWMLPLGKEIFNYELEQPILFVNSEHFHRWKENIEALKELINKKPGRVTNFNFSFLRSGSLFFSFLPPFSLIRDLGEQNTRGNVSKISCNLTCYRHVGSKSTNHSPLAWRREGQKATLVTVIGGFRSDMSITRKFWRRFWKRFRKCFVFQSRVSTKTVLTDFSRSYMFLCFSVNFF